jgi:hypothetical protein
MIFANEPYADKTRPTLYAKQISSQLPVPGFLPIFSIHISLRAFVVGFLVFSLPYAQPADVPLRH